MQHQAHKTELRARLERGVPEFIKIYTPILVHIEHPDHHLDSVDIELREIAIHQRLAQFPLRQMSRTILVD